MTPIEFKTAINDWKRRRAALKAELSEHPERYSEISRQLDDMDVEHHQLSHALEQRRPEDISDEKWHEMTQPSPENDFDFDTIFPSRPAPKALAKDHYRLNIDVSGSNADDLTHLLEIALYEVRKEIEKQKRDWLSRGPVEANGAMEGTVGSYKTSLKIGSKSDDDEIPY